MSSVRTQVQISEAFRTKDGKLPEIFRILAETKVSKDSVDTWIAAAKVALGKDEPERCKAILEAFRESNPDNIAATLLLSKACQRLGKEDALDESVMLARRAVEMALSSEDIVCASVQLAVSLGGRARIHTRQQLHRQRDREEAIRVLSTVEPLSAAVAPNAGPAAKSSSATVTITMSTGCRFNPDVAHGLYVLALLQAEQGGGPLQAQAVQTTAVAAWQAAQAAQEPQLTALSLVLLADLLSARPQGYKAALSCLAQAPTTASLMASTSASTLRGSTTVAAVPAGGAPPLWTDVIVLRLRSRLLGALGDMSGSLTCLVAAKKLLASWLERGTLPGGISRGMAEDELAKVWGELAVVMAQVDGGRKAEALAAVDHAVALRPWTAGSRHWLGVVHETLGLFHEAEAAYDDTLALDPTHAPTLLRKAALLARRGTRPDLAAARDLLAEALRYEPRCAAAWHELGCVAAALEHRVEAEEQLLTAVRLASEAAVLELGELPLGPP